MDADFSVLPPDLRPLTSDLRFQRFRISEFQLLIYEHPPRHRLFRPDWFGSLRPFWARTRLANPRRGQQSARRVFRAARGHPVAAATAAAMPALLCVSLT